MDSKNVTVTDARLMNALKRVETANQNRTIDGALSKTKTLDIMTGVVKKFFNETDTVEVKLKNKTVNAYNLSFSTGEVGVMWSPFGVLELDSKTNKTYFKSVEELNCIVLFLDDSYYVLGYFNKNKISEPLIESGVLKLNAHSCSIQISGGSGVIVDSPNMIYKDWTAHQWNSVGTEHLTEENITCNDYYTKSEIDEMLKSLKLNVNFTVLNNTSGESLVTDNNLKYHSNKGVLIRLTDNQDNPLANENVSILVNGVSYNKITDDNGEIIQKINLDVGDYCLHIEFNNIVKEYLIKIVR